MHYFSKVKLGQKLFSIIYGKGMVIFTLPKEHRLEGFYVFAVRYSKKNTVYYTVDGYPNWSAKEAPCQTVFYKDDLDYSDIDMQNVNEVLSEKKIIKYKNKDILEFKCPSGVWLHVDDVPESLIKKAFKKSKFDLFRKEKD